MILLGGGETPAALGERKSHFQGRRFISFANKKGGGSARPLGTQIFSTKKGLGTKKVVKIRFCPETPTPPPLRPANRVFPPLAGRVSLSLSLSKRKPPAGGAIFSLGGVLAASGTDAIPSRDSRCRERSIFSDWKSSSAQDMSKKVSFFYSCFVFRRACPLAWESSFRSDFSSWNSSSPQDMSKKGTFFYSCFVFLCVLTPLP